MSNTSSHYADFLAQPDRAQGHVATPDGFQPLLERQPDAQSAAGGVSSTVVDMANWMIMLLDEGRWRDEGFITSSVLLPAIIPRTISPPAYAADARAGFYGYGFDVTVEPCGRVRIGHSGAFYLGAETTLLLIPSLELGIVVLTNASPIGMAEVLQQNDGLLLVLGLALQEHRLSHWEGDSFAYPPFGETAPLGSLSEVAFTLTDGTAETMTIEFLDANGLGIFRRLD